MNYNSFRTDHTNVADKLSEKILVRLVRWRWGQNSGTSGSMPPFGPLDGWSYTNMPTMSNTRNARRFDPGYPQFIGLLVGIPVTLVGVLAATVASFYLILRVGVGIIALGVARTHHRQSSPEFLAGRENYRVRRAVTWAVAPALARAGSIDPRKLDALPPSEMLVERETLKSKAFRGGSATKTTIDLRIPAGLSHEDFENAPGGLRSTLQVAIARLATADHAENDLHRDMFLRMVTVDQSAFVVSPAMTPAGIERAHERNSVVVGHDETGKSVRMSYGDDSNKHLSIVGKSGSGKSAFLQSYICQLAVTSPVKVLLADLKSGAGLWGCAAAQVGHAFAAEAPDVIRLLEAGAQITKARNANPAWTASDDDPHIVIVVDEANDVSSAWAKADQERFWTAASIILRQGRSAGVHLILAAQRWVKTESACQALMSAALSQFENRLVLKSDPDSWQNALGAAYTDANTSTLARLWGVDQSHRDRGVGMWVDANGATLVKTRWISTAREVEIVSGVAISTMMGEALRAVQGFVPVAIPFIVDPIFDSLSVDVDPSWGGIASYSSEHGSASLPTRGKPIPASISVDDLEWDTDDDHPYRQKY